MERKLLQTSLDTSETSPPAHADAVAVRLTALAKAFGPTRALRSASLELRAGEIHALVGENASGKSTLVKILAGVYRPDSGALEIDGAGGVRLAGFPHPRASLRAGIATVFQEVLVVEPRSVLENVWLGDDGLLRSGRPAGERRRLAAAVLEELLAEPPGLDRPAETLSLSDRQACCVARALVRRPRVLVLDEATSALDVQVRDRLFGALRRLAAGGAAVIFISHRMDEIAEIADRCTVMRSGETVATLAAAEATPATLVGLMTGAEHLAPPDAQAGARRAAAGAPVLRTEGLRLRPGGAPADVVLRAGELVGLAGLEDHGQDAFLRALWGGDAASGSVVSIEGDAAAPVDSAAAASRHGIAYVPRDRRAEALFDSKSVRENFGLVTLGRDVRGGLLRPAATRARLRSYVERLRIALGDPDAAITTLSGGNQQKVVIARWLATEPRVLLLNDPTRGMDIGAKRDLYRLLGALAAAGTAIVMLSTELDELVELMDRVLVFREHELAAELPRERLSRSALVAAFFGERPGDG